MWFNKSITKKKLYKNFLMIAYLTFCAVAFILIGQFGDTRFTSDFDHYHSFWHRYTDLPLSTYSQELFLKSEFVDPNFLGGWILSPIYSVISTFSIALFGSPTLLNILLISFGLIYIDVLQKLSYKLFPDLSCKYIFLANLAVISNKWFINESIGLGSIFLGSIFLMLGILNTKKKLGILFHIFAFLMRPNYILFFLPLMFFNITSSAKSERFLLFRFYAIIFLFCLPWMLIVDSQYPGSGFNYIFIANREAAGILPQEFPIYLRKLGITDLNLLWHWHPTLKDTFLALTNLEVLNYVFQIFILKNLAFLGLRFNEAFMTTWGGYASEIWGTIYFAILMLPSYLVTVFFSIFRYFRSNNFLSSILNASIICALINSLLMGVPRYSILTANFYILFTFYLIYKYRQSNDLIKSNENNKLI